MKRTLRIAGMVSLLAGGSAAWAGPDWVEQGDAGATIVTAQRIVGTASQVTRVFGTLDIARGVPDLEDVYLIRVLDPGTFKIDLRGVTIDVSAYLFNVTLANQGFGLLGNLSAGVDEPGPFLPTSSDDGTDVIVTEPGVYALAITLAGRFPVSRTGAIFRFDSPTEVSGPDGVGGINPLTGWAGEVAVPGGSYVIGVAGGGFVDVPAPGFVAAAGMAGVVVARRRRR